MKFRLETSFLSKAKADVVCVGIFEGEDIVQAISTMDRSFAGSALLEQIKLSLSGDSFQAKLGQVAVFPTYGQISCQKLILLGLGLAKDFSPSTNRKAASQLARTLGNGKSRSIAYFGRLHDNGKKPKDRKKAVSTRTAISAEHKVEKLVSTFVEGFLLGSYSFLKYKSFQSDENKKSILASVSLSFGEFGTVALERALTFGQTIADATKLARDLIQEPALFMTPSRLADEAKRVAKNAGISCTVMGTQQIKELGMGAFLGVAKGAKEPAKFIVMSYQSRKPLKKVAIVGKGITFDSGGLSLKSAQSMEHMKYDMSGAAAVIATMQAIGVLRPRLSVIGIVAATENMPGGAALHPGDVVTSLNKKTVEVNNTDAEGRLVLADALSYACRQDVDEIIDIATLTSAIVTALGRVAAGIMGTDQKIIQDLINCGNEAGEKLWQMPLFDEYKESLKSDIADLKNAGSRGEAGSSCAAMFLKEFVDGKPWAHIDIAGPAWFDKDKEECNKGGTGFGVRTLCYYLLGQN